MILKASVLFLALLACAALAVWSVRDIVVFWFEDRYGIKIERDEHKTLD